MIISLNSCLAPNPAGIDGSDNHRKHLIFRSEMTSSILFQNRERTITLLDIPRSIEDAQGFSGTGNNSQLISAEPIQEPYLSIEPKSRKALLNKPAVSIEDILLSRYLELALEEVKSSITTSWCLPRIIAAAEKKRKIDESLEEQPTVLEQPPVSFESAEDGGQDYDYIVRAREERWQHGNAFIPPNAAFINGEIESTVNTFATYAPQFNLVIMDPPWPNRSARRKSSYHVSYGSNEIKALLSSISLQNHLAKDALVGVWVTNKSAWRDMLLQHKGFFDSWGLELAEEWVWLKVTTSGEPINAIESTWKKPYEVLLVGRKRSEMKESKFEVKRRVIIAVPDLHSRKPNLNCLFESLLPKPYQALEIFPRNLTAGWWAWGNEVLKFQQADQWVCE